MLSDKNLRHWYREFNRKYHNGRLPDDIDIVYAPVEKCSGLCEQFKNGEYVITINPAYALDRRTVKLTLHHEMVHIRVGGQWGHGPKFQKQMLRLAIMGAFQNLW